MEKDKKGKLTWSGNANTIIMHEEEYLDVEVSFQPDSPKLATFWKYYEMEQKFHASESGGKIHGGVIT